MTKQQQQQTTNNNVRIVAQSIIEAVVFIVIIVVDIALVALPLDVGDAVVTKPVGGNNALLHNIIAKHQLSTKRQHQCVMETSFIVVIINKAVDCC
jgi:hypothetical protein